MMTFFTKLKTFITDVANDTRIPSKDKKILLAMVALVLSPFDIIPDWIPVFGIIDDVIIISIILDYFFEVLDSQLLLSHFPWNMTRFAQVRRVSRALQIFVPKFIKKKLWSYVGSPY